MSFILMFAGVMILVILSADDGIDDKSWLFLFVSAWVIMGIAGIIFAILSDKNKT